MNLLMRFAANFQSMWRPTVASTCNPFCEFHISKAKIRAAMRPPLSLHMQLTEDAGLESRGCAALHGTYYVASSLAALSKIRSSVQDRSVGLRMEATRKQRTHTHSVDLVSQGATLLRAAQTVLPTSEQKPFTDSP